MDFPSGFLLEAFLHQSGSRGSEDAEAVAEVSVLQLARMVLRVRCNAHQVIMMTMMLLITMMMMTMQKCR